MKFENKTLKDYLSESTTDLREKANEFYQYRNYQYDNKHIHLKRIALNGSKPIREVQDMFTGEVRHMIYLASNDYLNLTTHPKVVEAGRDAILKYGAGAGSVPLLGGSIDLHEQLEKKVAQFKGQEAAIIFTSGFGANDGVLSSLLGKNDLAILDMLAHASIIDGCKGTNTKFFLHNDMDSLEKILKTAQGKYNNVLIAVDGVYSMDGDIAPLDKLHELAKRYQAYLYVDEAHASGVIGANGRGTPEHFGLEGEIDFVAGTFSKALGGVGGFVSTTKELAFMLNFFSRSYMFSTAMTPQVAASMLASIDVIEQEPERREKLWSNIHYFKRGLESLGFTLENCETAIFPLILGDDYKVKEAVRMLHEMNVYVNPVLYPAVSFKKSRIRMSLMCEHTHQQLDEVLNKLEYVTHILKINTKELQVTQG